MDEIKSLSSMLRLYTQYHQNCSNEAHFLRSVVQLYTQHHETCQDVHEESRTSLDRELESYRHVTEKLENANSLSANNIKFITVSPEGNKRQKIAASRTRKANSEIAAPRTRKTNSEISVETFTRILPKCEEFEEKLCTSKITDEVLPVPDSYEHQEVERLDTGHENARRRARETASWIKRAGEMASIARLYLFCFLTYCVVLEDDGMDREDLDDIMRLAFVEGGTSKYLKSLRTTAKMLHREIVAELVTKGWTFGQITQLFSFCGPLRAYEYTYFTSASCKAIVEKVKGLRIEDYPGYCIGSYISKWDSSFSIEKVHRILGYNAEPPNPTQMSTPHVAATSQVRSNTPLGNPGEGTQACFQNTPQAGINQNSGSERQAVSEDTPVQLSDLLGQDFRQDIEDWESIWANP